MANQYPDKVDRSTVSEPDHLEFDEVLQLLKFVSHCKPIVVGGQSINIWAAMFQGIDEPLDELGTLTSADIDFFQNKEAEKAMVASLLDGKLYVPKMDDHTPSASVVTGRIGDRKVIVDFWPMYKVSLINR